MKLTLFYFYFSVSFFLLTGITFAQEPKLFDKLENKAVIGFPGITTNQLNLISTEFAKYNQIATAKFVYKDHNCMLITFNPGTILVAYSDLLKRIHTIYDTKLCYFKPTSAFIEISNNYTPGTEFIVK